MKEGDVVALKSGGPLMTVVAVRDWQGVNMADCHWFNKDGEIKSCCYAFHLLSVWVRKEE
jgi:uncharacterized protein YodC (DUF2158 family)